MIVYCAWILTLSWISTSYVCTCLIFVGLIFMEQRRPIHIRIYIFYIWTANGWLLLLLLFFHLLFIFSVSLLTVNVVPEWMFTMLWNYVRRIGYHRNDEPFVTYSTIQFKRDGSILLRKLKSNASKLNLNMADTFSNGFSSWFLILLFPHNSVYEIKNNFFFRDFFFWRKLQQNEYRFLGVIHRFTISYFLSCFYLAKDHKVSFHTVLIIMCAWFNESEFGHDLDK